MEDAKKWHTIDYLVHLEDIAQHESILAMNINTVDSDTTNVLINAGKQELVIPVMNMVQASIHNNSDLESFTIAVVHNHIRIITSYGQTINIGVYCEQDFNNLELGVI